MEDLKKNEGIPDASGSVTESNDPAMRGRSPYHHRGGNHLWTGLFILGIGVVLLSRQMGVLFPGWLFSWPVLVIVFGLYIGIKHRFNNFSWVVILLIGVAFFIDQQLPYLKISEYIWPLVLIAIGLLIMSGAQSRRRRNWQKWREWKEMKKNEGWEQWKEDMKQDYRKKYGHWGDAAATGTSGEDFLDSTCVFGGVRKVILSKDFKGGDITNFCGGSEIDLTQADIKGRVTLDVTQVFGGTKIIVPAHWDVKSEIVAIFGGIEDKRRVQPGTGDPEKVLVLNGTSIFGGIEIRSY